MFTVDEAARVFIHYRYSVVMRTSIKFTRSHSFLDLAAFVGQPPHPTVMDLLQLKNGLHSSLRIHKTRATLAQKTCRTERGY